MHQILKWYCEAVWLSLSMVFFGKVSWTSTRYFWAETALGYVLSVRSLGKPVRRHKILVQKMQLLCLQLACRPPTMLIPVWICSLVKVALYCQRPLSYHVSQSNSRTYKTAPQKTVKSILNQRFSNQGPYNRLIIKLHFGFFNTHRLADSKLKLFTDWKTASLQVWNTCTVKIQPVLCEKYQTTMFLKYRLIN